MNKRRRKIRKVIAWILDKPNREAERRRRFGEIVTYLTDKSIEKFPLHFLTKNTGKSNE